MNTQQQILCVSLAFALLAGCGSSGEKLSRYTSSGDHYYAQEDYDAAQIEYSNALQQNPHHLPALQGLARVYDKKQQEAELYRTLARILEQKPQDVAARKQVVNLLSRHQQLGKALAQSEQLMAVAGDQVDVQVVHASLLYRNDRHAEGRALAQKVLEIEPENAHARMLLATEALDGGDSETGLEILKPALAELPNDLSLNRLQIRLMQANGDMDRVHSVFVKLLKEHPADLSLHQEYVDFLVTAGAADQALQVLHEFAQRHPSPETLLDLVRLIAELEGQPAADHKLRELTHQYPRHPELQIALAQRLLALARLEEAKPIIDQLHNAALDDRIRAQATLLRAEHASASGDREQALSHYRSVLEEQPQHLPAILGIAEIHLQQNETSTAIADLRAALTFAASSAEVHRLLGRAHAQQNLRELAQDHYSKAFELDPNHLEVAVEYAQFLTANGRAERAEDVLEKARRQGRMSHGSLIQLAQIKLALGKWQDAQDLADVLDANGASVSETGAIRGAALSGLSRHQESIEFYRQAYEAMPEQSRHLAALVNAYLRADQRQLADELLDKTLEKAPRHLHALLLKGGVHEAFGEQTAAEKRYRDALAVAPQSFETYRLLAQLLSEQDRLDDALALIRQGKQTLPGHLTFGVTEATILRRLGDIEGAEASYRQLLADNPEADIIYNNLALLLLERGRDGDLSEARTLAERFRHSQIPHFQDTLGWVYLQTGQTADAIYLLEKAAQGLPDVAEVQYHLGMAYLADDRRQDADVALTKALTNEQPYPWEKQARLALAELHKE